VLTAGVATRILLARGMLTTRILTTSLMLHQSGHDNWRRRTWAVLTTTKERRGLVWQGVRSEVAVGRHDTRRWLVASPTFIEFVGGFV
jgi:hypothetical protein